ncbi:MAG: MIP family channel protein [Planctomycetaceae bacterium]
MAGIPRACWRTSGQAAILRRFRVPGCPPRPFVHSQSQHSMKRLFAEAIGTFILVFAGTGAVVANDSHGGTIGHPGVALTFGLAVMSVIYAIGKFSGAHINPAVTIAFCAAGRFEGRKVVPYVISQCVGAIAASAVLRFFYPEHSTLGSTLPANGVSEMHAFVFEVLLTLILMFVVLNVSTGASEVGVMAGAAIGSVVAFEAMFAGPICGASMNPARSLGPALLSGNVSTLWIYLLAPVVGAQLAIPCFRCTQDE